MCLNPCIVTYHNWPNCSLVNKFIEWWMFTYSCLSKYIRVPLFSHTPWFSVYWIILFCCVHVRVLHQLEFYFCLWFLVNNVGEKKPNPSAVGFLCVIHLYWTYVPKNRNYSYIVGFKSKSWDISTKLMISKVHWAQTLFITSLFDVG